MKKPIFLLAAAMLLSSCGGGSGTPFSSSDTAVLTPEFVDQNLVDDETEVETDVVPTSHLGSKIFDSVDYTINTSYASSGLLIITNEYGYIGFYSKVYSTYILEPEFKKEWLSYQVSTDSVLGFLLRIEYEDKTTFYDSMGNVLKSYDMTKLSISSFTGKVINKKVYATLVIKGPTSTETVTTYYSYASGSPSVIDELPDEEVIVDTSDDKNGYEGPTNGDIFTEGSKDLSDYGYEGYYLYGYKGYYTTFDNTNKAIASFYIPVSSDSKIGFFGKNLIYQTANAVPEDASTYDYYDGSDKYNHHTYFVDVIQGKVEEKSINYVFEYFVALKDSEGKYSYSLFSYKEIDDKKTLSHSKLKIIDSNLTFHEDITGIEPQSFTKLSNGNYYNYTNKILFDSNLKPITYLDELDNLVFDRSSQTFKGKLNNKYGIVDASGKVVAEFRYSIINSDSTEGYFIGKDAYDDTYYRINTANASRSEIGKKLFKYRNYLYYTYERDTFKVFTPARDLDSFYNVKSFSFDEYSFYGAENSVTYLEVTTGNSSNTYKSYASYRFANLLKNQIYPIGNEKTTYVNSGASEKETIVLGSGSNKLHFSTQISKVYATYSPYNDGYVSFTYDNYLSLASITTSSGSSVTLYSSSSTDSSITKNYYLEDSNTYILTFTNSNNYTLMGNVDVTYADGSDKNLPLLASETGYVHLPSGTDDRYVKFTPKESKTAFYYVNKSNTNIKVYLGDSEVTKLYMPLRYNKTYTFRLSGALSSSSNISFNYTTNTPTVGDEILGYSENSRYSMSSTSSSGLVLASGFSEFYVQYNSATASGAKFNFYADGSSYSVSATYKENTTAEEQPLTISSRTSSYSTSTKYFSKGGYLNATITSAQTSDVDVSAYLGLTAGESVENIKTFTSDATFSISELTTGYYLSYTATSAFDGTFTFRGLDTLTTRVKYAVNEAPTASSIDSYKTIDGDSAATTLTKGDVVYFFVDFYGGVGLTTSFSVSVNNQLGTMKSKPLSLDLGSYVSPSGTSGSNYFYYTYTNDLNWARDIEVGIFSYYSADTIRCEYSYKDIDGVENSDYFTTSSTYFDYFYLTLPAKGSVTLKLYCSSHFSSSENWQARIQVNQN